jgi:phosphatidylinositol alpha-1,6-mannosyltransferase
VILQEPTAEEKVTALKVLALATDAFGGYGGIAQSTQDLILAMSRTSRIEAIDILPRRAPSGNIHLPNGIRQHAPKNGRLAYAARAFALMQELKPDLIYCGHAFMSPLAATLAFCGGAKFWIHVHGLEVWAPLSSMRRFGIEQADLALCVSSDTQSRLLLGTGLSVEQTSVIYNTVGDQFRVGDRQAARNAFDLGDETVLLTVSRLDTRQRHKGHDTVIRLIPWLRDRGHNICYLIAGEGDDQGRLERLAVCTGVSEHVRFLGRVPYGNLPNLYRAADCYVMPSTAEGFGIAYVEAMACGTPAIGLAIGGAGDALGHGELGVATNETAFPMALADLLERPPLNGDTLSRKVVAKFGRQSFEQRIDRCLEEHIKPPCRLLASGPSDVA